MIISIRSDDYYDIIKHPARTLSLSHTHALFLKAFCIRYVSREKNILSLVMMGKNQYYWYRVRIVACFHTKIERKIEEKRESRKTLAQKRKIFTFSLCFFPHSTSRQYCARIQRLKKFFPQKKIPIYIFKK